MATQLAPIIIQVDASSCLSCQFSLSKTLKKSVKIRILFSMQTMRCIRLLTPSRTGFLWQPYSPLSNLIYRPDQLSHSIKEVVLNESYQKLLRRSQNSEASNDWGTQSMKRGSSRFLQHPPGSIVSKTVALPNFFLRWINLFCAKAGLDNLWLMTQNQLSFFPLKSTSQ